MNHCCICQKPNKGTGWACDSCRQEFPFLKGSFADWPEWARECKRLEQNERRLYAAVDEMEIPFADLGIDIADFNATVDGTGIVTHS